VTYTFRNKQTGEIFSVDLKISQYDQFISEYTDLERYFDSAPAVTFNGKTFGSLDSQTDNTFKEVLAKIGEKHVGSPLAEKYRKNKTIKEIKTKEIVKKHVERTRKKIRERSR